MRHNGTINATWVDGHVTLEHQAKLMAGANDSASTFQEDWYYMMLNLRYNRKNNESAARQ